MLLVRNRKLQFYYQLLCACVREGEEEVVGMGEYNHSFVTMNPFFFPPFFFPIESEPFFFSIELLPNSVTIVK